jgi:ABC-type amino acid transport substrate-binding protein
MNGTYVRTILKRLQGASVHVARTHKSYYYPIVTKDVNKMSDDEVKKSINNIIDYLKQPELSHIMFRYRNN